ncbi:HAAS signaling domain-containing protein [Niallia sp. 03133]|uniref:HAAS signaling domain-containing protein n=1 Tax=Niallia sp. 03133 TaxID=3458060 RepID=UPI004043B92D
MIASKQEYLHSLRKKLKNNKDQDEIVLEYDHHLSDLLEELYLKHQLDEKAAMILVLDRFGTPEEIAQLYTEELVVTENKTKWIFFFGNLFFFTGGICLTIFYHFLSFPSIRRLWTFLTSIPFYLILLYLFFWLLLGYEVGKEFGLGGKKLLKKTFYISLAPNLLLMILVVFRIIPLTVFDPLLTPNFILLCIGATFFLYPISILGFRFGTIRSV